jgi:hypothetical protein
MRGNFFYFLSQFQNSSKLSKRPRFDLRKGAFSAVTLQAAASNYPLQFFAMSSLPSFELLLKLPLLKISNVSACCGRGPGDAERSV